MPRVYTRTLVAERFWKRVAKVDGDGCWLWTGCKQRSGYGRIASGDPSKPAVEGAHRIAYELQCGPIPADMSVLHHCDVPACCRGSHLFLGKAKDNTADMIAKGRNAPPPIFRGDAAVTAILSEPDVLAILASRETNKSLARRYGVAESTIKAVRDGTSWAHVGNARSPFGGRRAGEAHPGAKLTETDVMAIRASNKSSSELAREYGVNGATVTAARWGNTWKDLPPTKVARPDVKQIGENHHSSKLTAEVVRTIRSFSGPAGEIAAQLGVSPSLVNMVRRRIIWKHIE